MEQRESIEQDQLENSFEENNYVEEILVDHEEAVVGMQHGLLLGQGLMSLLLLILFALNFFMDSANLAPSYGVLALYWAFTAMRKEISYRLTKKVKNRVLAGVFLLFTVIFLVLYFITMKG